METKLKTMRKLKRWTADIDPATIPDSVLFAEVGRRRSAKRTTFGAGTGRPQKVSSCPGCGVELGVVDMRAHRSGCPGKRTRNREKQ
jgi:hypothetical protein